MDVDAYLGDLDPRFGQDLHPVAGTIQESEQVGPGSLHAADLDGDVSGHGAAHPHERAGCELSDQGYGEPVVVGDPHPAKPR
jgi:hypothetical protein